MLLSSAVMLLGCYALSGQDTTALIRASKESAAAYCKLDGGAALLLIRADHGDVLTVLWRNGALDGGLPDAGNIECP